MTIEDAGKTVDGIVRDLSAGGCFVSAQNQLEVGTHAVAVAIAGGEESFVFGAKVIRTVTDGDHPGMGLQFTEVGPNALRGIRDHLAAGTTVQVTAKGQS